VKKCDLCFTVGRPILAAAAFQAAYYKVELL